MSSYEKDAWDETGDMGNGILGAHLKCAKGRWLLDDKDAANAQICVIMESASTGQVLWQDGKIVDRDIGRIEDGFAPPRQLHNGWNPYTSFQAVRADEEAIGELVTFTSSSWGGRNAFQRLVNPYRLKQRRQFPICQLGTKERGDENRNIDPVFKIIGWSDRSNFGELLAPPDNSDRGGGAQAAIENRAAKTSAATIELQATKPRTAELIGDDIPF
jgi:hypothetical protein